MSELSIVSIGGGRPNGKASPLLERALDISGKDKPNVLLIPTAKTSTEAHVKTVENTGELYKKRLKVPFRVLHGFKSIPSKDRLEEDLEWADVVYISGGDTVQMMEEWKKHDINNMLSRRALKGMVLSGISAGAIAPFAWGHSDSQSYRVKHGERWDYVRADALGLVHAAISPHFNKAPMGTPRSEKFLEMFEKNTDVTHGLGLDNLAGVEIVGGKLNPISAKDGASVQLFVRKTNGVDKSVLSRDDSLDISTFTATS